MSSDEQRDGDLRSELSELRRRVERLERRFFGEDSEPPTMPGVCMTPGAEYSDSPLLDAIGEAFEGLGFGREDGERDPDSGGR